MENVLESIGVTKNYAGKAAVENVSLKLETGLVYAMLGPNGSGKTTWMKMVAGGMLEMIRRGGGIDYLIGALTRKVSGKRTAELSIAALVSMANLCTANNTIAIITTGP